MRNDREIFKLHSELCKVFSDPNRLEILSILGNKSKTVSDLVLATGLRQANVSQHLAILRAKKVVKSKRDGKQIIYSISDVRLLKAMGILRNILKSQLK